jgi:hypothetical protein
MNNISKHIPQLPSRKTILKVSLITSSIFSAFWCFFLFAGSLLRYLDELPREGYIGHYEFIVTRVLPLGIVLLAIEFVISFICEKNKNKWFFPIVTILTVATWIGMGYILLDWLSNAYTSIIESLWWRFR